MADEEQKDPSLLRVKADSTGVDVAIGRGLPGVIGRLLPAKFRLRRAVDHAIADRIIAKLSRGEALGDAEAAFAEDMLSDQAQKYIRLSQIQERAQQLIEAPSLPLLGPLPSASPDQETNEPRHTATDWVNKFREDAGLVDDELVREIYARVLCEEQQRPGAFALRTLGVLRYLDRETATAFGRLQKVVIDGSAVPQQERDENHVLDVAGLDHQTMLMLSDAGLVNSATNSEQTREGTQFFAVCSGHSRVLSFRRPDGSQFKIKFKVHLLTPAGIQLARIAESEPDERAFSALISWLKTANPRRGNCRSGSSFARVVRPSQ